MNMLELTSPYSGVILINVEGIKTVGVARHESQSIIRYRRGGYDIVKQDIAWIRQELVRQGVKF